MLGANDLDSLGLFSLSSSVNIGSKYGERAAADARLKGKQFSTSPSKKGAGSDVTFTPFTSTNVGDPYITPEQRRREYEREKKKKMIVPTPFKPSNPTQRGSGHGTMSQYGNFGSFKYMKTSADTDGRTIRKPLAPRNFLTSPSKRGTYGMVGINIGGKIDGVVGELTYSMNPPRERERPKTTSISDRPFSPTSPAKRGSYGMVGLNIGGKASGINGEFAYESDGLFNRPRTTRGETVKPFVPSSPSKLGPGIYGTVGSYPEYSADPEDAKMATAREHRATQRSKILGPVFRPSGVPKTVRQPSIMSMKMNHNKSF
mmetsp:Transcript_40118/g.64681  ORF Transcript_40118/g.64681 Transcript_40118/m.64681 type:complete len:316 (+) Transcript_40118:185-1132(+)